MTDVLVAPFLQNADKWEGSQTYDLNHSETNAGRNDKKTGPPPGDPVVTAFPAVVT